MIPVVTQHMVDAAAGYTKTRTTNDDVARWELVGISPVALELYSYRRHNKSRPLATVWSNTGWHTWTWDGIGGENGGEEIDIDTSISEAFKAVVRQGFL